MIKVSKPSSTFADVRSSRGFVRNEAMSGSSTVDEIHEPPNEYRLLDLMWRSDPVIHTAFTVLSELITRNGYSFVPTFDDKRRIKDERKKIQDRFFELNFDEVQDNWLLSWLKYGDAFVELRRTKGKKKPIDELWTLETTEMRIKYNPHGQITGYVQRPFNLKGLSKDSIKNNEQTSGVHFDSSDIMYLRLIWDGSSVYSVTPLEPIARSWSAKQNALTYLDKILVNLPPELMVHLKGANSKQKNEFMELLYRRRSTPGMPVVSYGSGDSGIQVEKVDFTLDNGIMKVLEYLREEVLMITRVPPIWVGMADNEGANARNSEAQVFSLETHVQKLQQKAANYYSRVLLPALGFKDWRFKFNPVSARSEKETIQNAAVFQSLNIKPMAIVKYLRRNGISDFEEDDFTKPEEMMEMQQKFSNNNQASQNMNAPSRQPKEGRKELSREGTSADGAKKMDEQRSKMR